MLFGGTIRPLGSRKRRKTSHAAEGQEEDASNALVNESMYVCICSCYNKPTLFL